MTSLMQYLAAILTLFFLLQGFNVNGNIVQITDFKYELVFIQSSVTCQVWGLKNPRHNFLSGWKESIFNYIVI